MKNGGIGVNYCWSYGPSKLLLDFIEYRLDKFNNKQMKTAVNLTIQFFESRHRKKYLVKVWSFLAHPPQNDDPLSFLGSWTETIFSNFTNISHLVSWKRIIWAKSDLLVMNSVCEKVWVAIYRLSKMLRFNFCLFHFSKFQMTIVKNLMKKPSFFIMNFEGSNEVLLRHKYF